MGIKHKDIKHGLNPYPAYKDSGVEWLGKIPVHWEVKRLSLITECLDGRRVPLNAQERGTKQGNYPYWGANSIVDYVDDWLFDEELVLIGEDGAPFFDSNRPVAFHVTGRIWVNNHMHVLRPNRQIVANFLFNVLNCVDYRAFIDGATRDKLTQGDMKAILIQCPTLPEQRAIAAFLDRETAKIDALIAKKERLARLLQEKRTALISRAVTKGLDPDVPLKDSGVEWLGEIPAHWAPLRLKHITTEVTVGVVVNPSSYVCDEGVPFIYGSDIRESGIVADTARKMSNEHSELLRKSRLQAGDLVTVRVGAPGVTAVVPPELEGANCASVVIIRRANSFNSDWLCYVINSRVVRYQIELVQYGAAQEQFNVSHAVEFLVPMPPIDEQTMLAAFLDRETAQIDALVAKVQEAIDRLKELRTALISAAVTGKIDVREAAV